MSESSMSEPTSIKNLRDLVSPTTLGTFHVEPAAVLSAYDTMKQRAEAAEAERESVSSQLWDCMNEREALRTERDALRANWSGLLIEQARLMALRDDAVAERDALRKDAERYRWLVSPHGSAMTLCSIAWRWPASRDFSTADECIDAALAVQPTTSTGIHA